MIADYQTMTETYLINARRYETLTDTVKRGSSLTRDTLIKNLSELAAAGGKIAEESKPLMLALGLIDKTERPKPAFSLGDAYALFEFARMCNKSGDLPWSDEEAYDELDDSLLALDILKIVVDTADKYHAPALKIRAAEWLCHHSINNAAYTVLLQKGKAVCADILKTPYESLPCKTFADAKAKLTYALLLFNYGPLCCYYDTTEDYDNLFEWFKKAAIFEARYTPGRFNVKLLTEEELEQPKIRDWTATLMDGATPGQTRELLTRWYNYAKSTTIVKQFAGMLFTSSRKANVSPRCAAELNAIYNEFLGERITRILADPYTSDNFYILSKELVDDNSANLITSRIITDIVIRKSEGHNCNLLLRLLRDIAKGILRVPNNENWYAQDIRQRTLAMAVATLCEYSDSLPPDEKQQCLQIAFNTMKYMQRQSKDVKDSICHCREERRIIIKSCCELLLRREYIEFHLNLASQEHLATYAHSLVVAKLNSAITSCALKYAPQFLIGIKGTRNTADVRQTMVNEQLRADFIEEMELAGLGHDLGKVFQVHAVSQYARPLTDTEYNGIIRRHSELGAEIFDLPGFELIKECTAKHHAYAIGNGKRGYPDNANVADSPFKNAINITHISDVLSATTDSLGGCRAKPLTTAQAFELLFKDSEEINGNMELDRSLVSFILSNAELKSEINEILNTYNEEAYYKAYKALG